MAFPLALQAWRAKLWSDFKCSKTNAALELPHLDWHEVRERGRIAENLRRSIASIFTGHWVSQVETLGRIDRMNGFCPVLRESPHLQFRNHLEATLCRPEDETACHFCMKLQACAPRSFQSATRVQPIEQLPRPFVQCEVAADKVHVSSNE